MTPVKTYKRETASLMLTILFGMFVWGVSEPTAGEYAKFLTPFVFVFAAGAWGLDAWSKQLGGDQ